MGCAISAITAARQHQSRVLRRWRPQIYRHHRNTIPTKWATVMGSCCQLGSITCFTCRQCPDSGQRDASGVVMGLCWKTLPWQTIPDPDQQAAAISSGSQADGASFHGILHDWFHNLLTDSLISPGDGSLAGCSQRKRDATAIVRNFYTAVRCSGCSGAVHRCRSRHYAYALQRSSLHLRQPRH